MQVLVLKTECLRGSNGVFVKEFFCGRFFLLPDMMDSMLALFFHKFLFFFCRCFFAWLLVAEQFESVSE